MLTKSDLSQIDQVVTKRIKSENDSLEARLDKEFDKIEKRFVKVDKRFDEMDKRFDKLERKLDYAINFLDRDYLKLLHRVEAIEEHLHLEPASI